MYGRKPALNFFQNMAGKNRDFFSIKYNQKVDFLFKSDLLFISDDVI